ncbi:MAG: GerW family sporulation protein [Omnitrophica WOR_2 bacterium]
MDEEINVPSGVSGADEAIDIVEVTLDKFLDAADVEAVYGQAVQHGDYVIIPSAEVLAGLGFGIGYGSGPAPVQEGENAAEEKKPSQTAGGGGGGGGGRILSRPVAVIIASPDGVRVEPVLDVTKVALAALTAAGFMVGMLARMSRSGKY